MVIARGKDNVSKVSSLSNFGVDKKNLSDGSNLNGDLGSSSSNLATELELLRLLQNQRLFIEREDDFNISRSGSAPPTVEGAFRAFGSLHNDSNIALVEKKGGGFSKEALTEEEEEEIRLNPAYLAYYYSNENSNPRLPPPLISRENWRAAQRVQGRGSTMGGGMGMWMTKDLVNNDSGSSSLFSMQPQILMQKPNTPPIEMRKTAVKNFSRKNSTESLASLGGLSQKSGMGGRRKSFADIVQEGLGQSSNSHGHLSQPSSHNSLSRVLDAADTLKISSTDSENIEPLEAMLHPLHGSSFSRGLALSKSFSAAGSSSTETKTSERHQTLRCPPGFPVVQSHASQDGEENMTHPNTRDTLSGKTQVSDILTSFPGLSLSNDQFNGSTLSQSALDMGLANAHLQNMQQQFSISRADKYASPHFGFRRENGVAPDVNYINFDRQVNLPRRTSSSVNLHSLGSNSSEFSVLQDPKIKYQGSHLSVYSLNGQSQRRSGMHSHPDLHSTDTQPDVLLEQSAIHALQAAAMMKNLSQGRNFNGTSYDTVDLQDLERVYVEALLLGQQIHQVPSKYQYGDTCMLYQGIPRVQFQNERCSPIPTFKVVSGFAGSCNTASGTNVEGKLSSSLLGELKNNKNKSLELLDVLDHFVEFSMDQYGSRFIQQKLEIATIEDKMKIFPWVLPHVRGLMTDVFGNYVIQKFFEHGTEIQRKELADQLLGHVLPLSLQMYGCRVVQKALEVVDLEQQILLVAELNGSVMKCVHDQNGNHVIQKCIECIPEDKIKFIISSFFGQVVTLSTHPYGCRVIQRVLEHCNDPNTQQIIMDEIMKSVCILAQDQYGNYVIQHVLQHGKPHEKTEIIVKLSGQIVRMSQQKFASNVVEKCLTYGGPEQRKILINEMLGSTDDNEAFQAMMKDPFGNYVVQKVLETCDDECRELIISRIKVHLNALKRYTYGKHIVSRVEKLIETGERHRGVKA